MRWFTNMVKELSSEDFKEVMAAITLISCICFIFAVVFVDIREENQRFADVGLGGMLGIFLRLMEHYFGDKKADNAN